MLGLNPARPLDGRVCFMALSIGYLLPTRERVMTGDPGARELLELARQAEDLGFDSLWVGDSLLARPRHDPLTLLAAVAATVSRPSLGTAILLSALRNPVVLAQQLATLDQISEGRLILGIGIGADTPAIRAEFTAAGVPFEKRLGRTLEGLRLCRALWRGEPVDWDGRWKVNGQVLGPVPCRPGGPPLWMGTATPEGLIRTGKHFDGWFPLGPDAATWKARWGEVQRSSVEAGRSGQVTPAMYLTIALDDDASRAQSTLNTYLATYYAPAPAAMMRRVQACYAGPAAGLAAWLAEFTTAGASHLVLRFAGDHQRLLQAISKLRSSDPALS
jgi:alkanesulfonate monooxygenase SsuD/methylene tetrahydromethanopterin reductase-like flavin-dependent oxidoreductase (luciferase family)